ncbi:glycosyltransferase family 2 protein [Flavicella sediminum]|uniref:glycosyltransferase family 2 protein n=1 Tax=Flavicella sediminum TaxID=2585141 RepID=UPI00111CA4F9|nr:glycosyltransferase family 2 protein [Flavicella sediminum]
MNNVPAVSIIIPTYNRAYVIRETLDCVLSQSFANWECVIVDDFSTDETNEIVSDYCKKDSRFVFIEKNVGDVKGASASRNLGIMNSRGAFIKFLDSDDLIDANNIKLQYEDLVNESPYTASICRWAVFSDSIRKAEIKTNMTYYKNFSPGLKFLENLGESNSYIPPVCNMINRRLLDAAGMWDERLSLNDDGEFFARIFLKTEKIIFTPDTLGYYRKTENSLSVYERPKLASLVLSWQLTENHMRSFFKEKENIYVRNSKRRIFTHLRNDYFWFLVSHFWFFREVFTYKFLGKLKYMISK